MDVLNKDNRWLVFRLSDNKYAMACSSVSSLFQMPECTVLQNYDKNVNGVIKYQGKIIQLINLKKLLNVKTTEEEIKEFKVVINQQCQDYLSWFQKLESKIVKNTSDSVNTDIEKSEFSQWYSSFDFEKYNIMFISAFKKFDRPHRLIYENAKMIEQFYNKGSIEKATDIINKTKENELKQILDYFDSIKEVFENCNKEIVVVFSKNDIFLSFTVDEVMSIEELKDIETESIDNSGVSSEYIAAIAKRKNNEVTFILDEEVFFDYYGYSK